jgi:hypothetical protein
MYKFQLDFVVVAIVNTYYTEASEAATQKG